MTDKKAKQYVSDNPRLMAEWDWEKNAHLGLAPDCVAQQSNKKAWWKCEKGHEWDAVISHRTKGAGCPYCSNKKVLVGYNDLATTHPILADEWHPTKNGKLKPTEITHGSGNRVWWQCALGHEWQTSPNHRTSQNTSCPICSHKKILVGYNDLVTTHPSLANEWHPTLNGCLTPADVSFGSSRKVWWKCQKGHEWQASISNRSKNRNCPICSKQRKTSFHEQALYYYVKRYFSDAENTNTNAINMELDIYIPSKRTAIEYDGVFYHNSNESKDREQRKNSLCKEKGIRLIRVRETGLTSYGDCMCITNVNPANPIAVADAITAVLELLGIKEVKVDLDADSSEILSSYLSSDHIRSLLVLNPLLASEWHPTKNGDLRPEHLASNSGKKVWWICEKGHEWPASLHNRSKGKGCPYCSGRFAISGVNDLLTVYPDIVCEWNNDLNGSLRPIEVKAGSGEKVWWTCRTCGHNWETTIASRTSGHGCPKCGDLKKGPQRKKQEVFVEELADVSPSIELVDNYESSMQKVRCRCKVCQNEWEALPSNLLKGKGCPYCSGRRVITGENDLEYMFENIANEWDWEKNKQLLPSEVKYGSNKKVWWRCSVCGYSWQSTVANRTHGRGCPMCGKKKTGDAFRKSPETFANEIKRINPNIELKGDYVSTKQRIESLCLVCGQTWNPWPSNLLKGHGCPNCARSYNKHSRVPEDGEK